jgi:hypothetical protein
MKSRSGKVALAITVFILTTCASIPPNASSKPVLNDNEIKGRAMALAAFPLLTMHVPPRSSR